MRGQHIANIVRAVWQQALDRTPARVGIVNPVALDHQAPGLVEGVAVVGGIQRRGPRRLDKKCSGIVGIAQQHCAMSFYIAIDLVVQTAEVGKCQPEGAPSKEGRLGILECDGRDQYLPAARS